MTHILDLMNIHHEEVSLQICHDALHQEEYDFFDRILRVKSIQDESHIVVIILNGFKEALDVFVIKDLLFDTIIVVTDCVSNIVDEDDISSKFDLLECIDHKIVDCVIYIFNKTRRKINRKKNKPFQQYLDESNMSTLYTLIDDD